MNVVLRKITAPEWDKSATILSAHLNVCVKKSILRAVTLVNEVSIYHRHMLMATSLSIHGTYCECLCVKYCFKLTIVSCVVRKGLYNIIIFEFRVWGSEAALEPSLLVPKTNLIDLKHSKSCI